MRKLVISLLASLAFAAVTFADGVPSGWTCTGNCGTSGANGSVPLSPVGGYDWISTTNGIDGVGQLPSLGGTNGSTLISPVFSASAGSTLSFLFDYVSSDGGFPLDYAWAALYTSSGTLVAVLLTDQTGAVAMQPGTTWSPLGSWSGQCGGPGCGNTGWMNLTYTVGASGSYYIEFGVTNVGDEAFDSGLAIAGLNVSGRPVGGPVPEPATLGLLAMGLGGLAATRRRRIA
jgi:hypothetical protein